MFYEEENISEVLEDCNSDLLGELTEHLGIIAATEICRVAKQNMHGMPLSTVSPENASRLLHLNESVPNTRDYRTVIDEGFMTTSVHDVRYMTALDYALSGKTDEKEEFVWEALRGAEELYDGPGEPYLVEDRGLVIIDRSYLREHCTDDDLEGNPYREFMDAVEELNDWVQDALEEEYLVTVTYDKAMNMGMDWAVARLALSFLYDDLMRVGGYEVYLTRTGLTVLNIERLEYMARED